MLWVFFALCHIIGVAFNNLVGDVLRLQEVTTIQLLERAAYPVETHSVTTDDGYQLTLHRIPHGLNVTATKGPILLMHGLLCSSADWVVTGDSSMGLKLANAGYDVWMGNNRGNTYSRQNSHLDPLIDHEAFFDYSYHEMGKYDLPAMIDYILRLTGASKIPYLGFSEGTTQFFVLMSERPEYNDKISVMNAWAPVTNMYQIKNLLINLLAKHRIFEDIGKTIRWYEMFPHAKVGNLFRGLCEMADWFCSHIFHLIGFSWDRMPNKDMKSKILENFPAGMSFKQLGHYVQGARSGIFQPFVYDSATNIKMYGKGTPDPYDLSRIRIPIFVHYGLDDSYINNDVLRAQVLSQISSLTVDVVNYKNFDHLDFIWSSNVDKLQTETLKNLDSVAGAAKTTAISTTVSPGVPSETTTERVTKLTSATSSPITEGGATSSTENESPNPGKTTSAISETSPIPTPMSPGR